MLAENDGARAQPLFIEPLAILAVSGTPYLLDWNTDGTIDLFGGGELFANVNPRSSSRLPLETSHTPGGSRRPHPWTLPKLESRGTASLDTRR
jgi:hypothetical protein